MRTIRHALVSLALLLPVLPVIPALADDALPSQQEFEPPGGQGRLVIVISGQTGPLNYQYIAKDLSSKGYYAVLVDGNAMFGKEIPGAERLRALIEHGRQSPHAAPGKAAVVGFSLGGGATLTYAPRMPDLVSAVVATYPATRHIKDPAAFVSKFQVPVLLMAGKQDTYRECCLIETARALSEAAKASGKAELLQLVEYDAGHGWNIKLPKEYRADVAADSFQRTLDFLQAHP